MVPVQLGTGKKLKQIFKWAPTEGPEAKFAVVLSHGFPVPGTAGTPAGLTPAHKGTFSGVNLRFR